MGSPLTFLEERCAGAGAEWGVCVFVCVCVCVCVDHPLLGGRKKTENKLPDSINSLVSGGAAVPFTDGCPYVAWGGDGGVARGDCPSVRGMPKAAETLPNCLPSRSELQLTLHPTAEAAKLFKIPVPEKLEAAHILSISKQKMLRDRAAGRPGATVSP